MATSKRWTLQATYRFWHDCILFVLDVYVDEYVITMPYAGIGTVVAAENIETFYNSLNSQTFSMENVYRRSIKRMLDKYIPCLKENKNKTELANVIKKIKEKAR